jgi:hypothetical protein
MRDIEFVVFDKVHYVNDADPFYLTLLARFSSHTSAGC